MSSTKITITEGDISRRLAENLKNGRGEHSESRLPPGLFSSPARSASVLIPLLREDDHWHLLFTRRNAALAEHSGQVAFPGGRAEPEDLNPEITALREAQEEIGLDPADVRILGRLKNFQTITNYQVTPIVGVMPWPYSLRLAEDEVSRVFTIPLEWLINPANHELRPRVLPPPFDPISIIYFNLYDGELLWGISAQFTLSLIQALKL